MKRATSAEVRTRGDIGEEGQEEEDGEDAEEEKEDELVISFW